MSTFGSAVRAAALALAAATCGDVSSTPAPTPPQEPAAPGAPAAPAAGLTFTVNTARRFPISRLIYGMNHATAPDAWSGAEVPREVTFNRMGGNRLSAYNWETNYSNAGSDYKYQNDQLMSTSTTPGEAVRVAAAATFARGASFMATIPMLPYVAGDACNCEVGTSDADRASRLARHFKRNVPARGAPFPDRPDPNDAAVYQDEFVRWAARTFPGATGDSTRRLVFSLDNEPDLWHGTHKEIQSDYNDDKDRPRTQTYDGLIDTSIAFAKAVKSVAPDALVFGPAVATYTGYVTLGQYPKDDPVYGSWRQRPFLDVYLARMRAAEAAAGRRLLDVLDVHWYPAAGTRAGEVTNDYAPQDSAMIEARVQAPRSLWDPGYHEHSWVTEVTGGPIRLLPRLKAQIAAHYPGTRLSISEYFYGRAGDISGGVAQADVLGIFGREGVFAATLWGQAGVSAPPYGGRGDRAYAYAFGAFRMFLNYDGAGGRFGDTGVEAATSDAAASSVYASLDAQGRVVLVAINKRRTPQEARITLTHDQPLRAGRAYTLTAAGPSPARGAELTVGQGNALTYAMPAMSVSTLVLAP